MNFKIGAKKRLALLLVISALATNITSFAVASPTAQQTVSKTPAVTVSTTAQAADTHTDTADINKAYLAYYFGVKDIPASITWASFNDGLKKVAGVQAQGKKATDAVKFLDAAKMAVIGANLEELALTYPDTKVTASFKKYGINKKIDSAYAKYLACAFDTGLIKKAQSSLADKNSALDKNTFMQLLMAVADANGSARNFIGYTDEPNIYGKLINAREAFVLFNNEKLASIGIKAIMNKITTGYNLRCSNYDANFLPELTLRYGHSTTKHASQILGLLASEGIVAKVQLEPKTSIFEYLPEWGDVPPATPDYKVEKVNDKLMLAYSLEYDMVLEFRNQADKLKFDKLIMSYAKKNSEDKDSKALLFASWWQPLYVSSVEMKDGYEKIYDNVMTDGIYSLHPFCMPKDLQKAVAGFKAIDATIKIETLPLWCDQPFFRYLQGDYQ